MIPKYRAWHKQQKAMYYVEIMYLGEDGGVEVFDKWVTDFTSGEKDMATKFFTFDDVELMQCITIKDSKSNAFHQFYEGDLFIHRYPAGQSIYKAVVGKDTHEVDGL